MDSRLLTLLVFTVSLTHFSEGAEDFKKLCADIKFKHDENEACTDGAKHPIVGNCTHYYKCDGLPSGVLLHEAFTECPLGQFYDHKTTNCIQGSPEQIANCDQKKCATFYQSPEGIEEGKAGGYGNQGQGQGPQYPNQGPGEGPQYPNQGPGQGPQYPNQGPGPGPQYPNQGPGQGPQYPNQGPDHVDPYHTTTVKPQAGKPQSGKKSGTTSVFQPVAISLLCASIFLTSTVRNL